MADSKPTQQDLFQQGGPRKRGGRGHVSFSPEEALVLAAEHEAGASVNDLARKYDSTGATVAATIRRIGREVRSRGEGSRKKFQRYPDAVEEQMVADYDTGETCVSIARRHGMHVVSIRHIILERRGTMERAVEPIPPFPDHIDRNAFGNWLSGITDGEGYFFLGLREIRSRKVPTSQFEISLRADDVNALLLIRAFWGCGCVKRLKRAELRRDGRISNPCCEFIVSRAEDLISVVIPHFEANPLYAKKRQDFEIWKIATKLKSDVVSREMVKLPGKTSGFEPKWTAEELRQFEALWLKLREERACKDSGGASPSVAGAAVPPI